MGGGVLLPGAALVELVVRAGDEAGCPVVDELVIESAVVVPDEGVQVQVLVGAADGGGRCAVSVSSRAGGGLWVRTAGGLAGGDAGGQSGGGELGGWPPAGASVVDLDGFYGGLAAAGYEYGPGFRGLEAVWRRGEEVFAEVALPEQLVSEAGRYGLHPALLDAALQAANAGGLAGAGSGELRLPFSFGGVVLHASGASRLRVKVAGGSPDRFGVQAFDPAGRLVVSVGSVVLRAVPAGQWRAGQAAGELLRRVEWVPVAAGAGGWESADVAGDGSGVLGGLCRFADVAAVVAARGAGGPGAGGRDVVDDLTGPVAGGPAERARVLAGRALRAVQSWLGSGGGDGGGGDGGGGVLSRLVVVTRGAAGLGGEGVPAAGAAGGLVRSARSENPGRIVLADVDGGAESVRVLAGALGTGEPELAVYGGSVLVPRLAAAVPAGEYMRGRGCGSWTGTGTVLVTGGTGDGGARVVARHLAAVVTGSGSCCWSAAGGRMLRGRGSWRPSWVSWARRCGSRPVTWRTGRRWPR